MSRRIWNAIWIGSALAIGLDASVATYAAEPASTVPTRPEATSPSADNASTLQQINDYSGKPTPFSQVTSVSQFSDVRPTDWAFQALQSLVERYGCIVGYPDKTYRGNRATTRYEFAAGLNACLDKIQELIAAATADFVRKEDLEVVKRLQEEFAAELAALRGRVEALDVRTATLEKQQFSTTTKLAGEVIFTVADTFGDRATRTGNDLFVGSGVNNIATENALENDRTETIFGSRARLIFDSSFSGKDRLRVRLNAINITPFQGAFTGTGQTRLSYDGNNSNAVEVDKLYYRFPIGANLRVQVDAFFTEYNEGLISTLSLFESASQGGVSRFSRFNPTLRTNNPGLPGGAGVTFSYDFSPLLSLQGGFTSDRNSNDPGEKNGLFNGEFTAIGQLVFRPSRSFDIGLTYIRAYSPGTSAATAFNQAAPNITGGTGTGYAANPFAGDATSADVFSAQVQWRLTPRITIGGWYGYTFANNRRTSEEARISNWAGFLGFPDFGRKGSLLGFLFGVTPRVVDTDFRARFATGPLAGQPNPNVRRRLDEDPPYHLEAFYRYRINDNISITPGVFVLFNPEGNSANNTQFVGLVRTTFSF